MASSNRKKPMLTGPQRQEILSSIVFASYKGDGGKIVLRRGICVGLAKKFNCDGTIVQRLWARAKANFEKHGCFEAPPLKKGQCERKKLYEPSQMAVNYAQK
jgi:hypothetical protein